MHEFVRGAQLVNLNVTAAVLVLKLRGTTGFDPTMSHIQVAPPLKSEQFLTEGDSESLTAMSTEHCCIVGAQACSLTDQVIPGFLYGLLLLWEESVDGWEWEGTRPRRMEGVGGAQQLYSRLWQFPATKAPQTCRNGSAGLQRS